MFKVHSLILYFLSHSLFKSTLLSALFLVLVACGDSTNTQNNQASQNHVSGNAVKGVITNGIVSAYLVELSQENVSNTERKLLGQSRTNNAGEYDISIPMLDNNPVVVLELTADSQTTMRCDLVDGCLYPDTINTSNILLAEFGEELPVPSNFKLLGYRQGESQENAFISPLSHIIYTTASSLPGGISSSNLETASNWVVQTFHLEAGLLTAKTPDLTALSDLNDLTNQQLKLGILSSAFYTLAMSDSWSNGHIDLNQLPLEEIFRDAAYSAATLSEQLSPEQSGYSEALSAINAEAEAIVQTFESKQLVITQQPNSLTINETQSFSLLVQASGDGDLSYQWTKNNLNISGANSASYGVASANLSDAGSYSVIITNNGIQLTSLNALVSVNKVIEPVSITQQPQSLNLTAGDSINLSVGVIGDGPFDFQWKKDNQDIFGANSASYSIASASLSDAGSYNVTITSNGQSLTSFSALISVNKAIEPASITQHPQSLNLTAGGSINLSVGVTGDGPFDYQWRKDNQDISGANSASYSIASASLSDAGSYNVTITSNGQSLTSFSALISVNKAIEPASITQQPQSLNLSAGDSINLSVGVTGDGPFDYQWKKDNKDIPGANSASYSVANASLSDAGSYNVTITSNDQSLTSLSALISINPIVEPISITQQPQPLNLTAGDSINLSVGVTGDGPLDYQWQKEGSILPGETNSTLYIAESVEANSGTYRVSINNSVSEASSDFVSVIINAAIAPVTISQHPQDLTVTEGETARFQISATGGGFISYQWRKNNVNIANAYNYQLEISPTEMGSSGDYDAIVTNSRGSIISDFATLTVLSSETPVSITLQPTSKSVFLTDSINLRTEASGDGNLSYQWFFNEQIIDGATQAEYSINSAEPEHQGSYTVRVNNTNSSEESLAAFISVVAKPSIQLSWETPSFREDGSPLDVNEISAYLLEYGPSPTAITGQIRLTDASITQNTITNLDPGVLYVHIATVDSSGIQGSFSDWISIIVE